MFEPTLAFGIYFWSRSAATGSWHAVGITPFGKIAFHPTPDAGAAPPAAPMAAPQPGRPAKTLATNGSLIVPPNCCPAGAMAEKSPVLSGLVGTMTCEPDCPCTIRR